MNSDMTTFITLISTSGFLSLYILIYIIVKRKQFTKIINLFILTTACTVIYCFASAFALLSTSIEQIAFWTTIQYMGMPFSPPLGLLFVMSYLGKKVPIRRVIALFVIPVISLVMVATNQFHHLHYRVFELEPTLGAPFVHLEIGTWYMIHGVFTFGCMFVAFLFLIFRWKETTKVYKLQLIALMFGQLVPMVTAFLYLVGLTPPGVDPVPMVLWLTSLLYLWAISTSRLFTIMPIAKDAIFNSINDGVIVLDETNRLIEYNQACKTMFSQLNKSMYGLDFNDVWIELSGNAFPFNEEMKPFNQEVQLGRSERVYQVRTSYLINHQQCKGLLIIFTDITDLKQLQVKLEHLAYYDDLTKIFNRRAFFEQSKRDFSLAKEQGLPFSVILLDIDYFKKVNDTYGHHVGDQLLVHIVNVFESQLKEDALFARYGGEEFVLALNGHGADDGYALATRLCGYLRTKPFITSEGNIPITVSCGVAEATNEDGETLYKLLNKADKALYEAKGEGRNRVNVYSERNEVYS